MDYALWKFWIDILQTLVTAALGFWLYIDRRSDRTNHRIDSLQTDVDGRLDDHADRLGRVEEGLKHVPSHADLGAIHEKINDVATSNSRIAGEMSQLRELVQNIHQFLLNNR